MTVEFTEADLADFRQSVRGFLSARSPVTEVRRLMETGSGFDEAVWAEMAGQLGLQGLTIPEEYGGTGFGMAQQSIVLEELGRTLACLPYFSSIVLGANAIMQVGGDEAKEKYLPGLADGTIRAAAAFSERTWAQGTYTPEASAYASRAGQWKINGRKSLVIDGLTANLLLVTARTQLGTSLFAVDASAAGVQRTAVPVIDLTRKHADITFDQASGWLVGAEGAAAGPLARVADLALIALAAEQVGGADRCLEITLEYLKVREAFGRLLGSFQALKHRCADMMIAIQSGQALSDAAADAVDNEDWQQASVLAALAKATCSEMYAHVTAETVQMHGGIGFTWEHDAHLYFKRARTSQYLFGAPAYYRERALEKIGV
jgi:alkylation response protein AidB-like acyl-CoA dehydrogenase